MKLKKNYSLKNLTTMKVGGPARYFTNVRSENNLAKALKWAGESKIKWCVIGDSSNLLPNDDGFDGLIIKNKIKELKTKGNNVFVGSGNNLLKFIFKLNRLGLAGIEKMAGIPGTVGGAIYGAAGAYGQEIKDCFVKVKVFDTAVWEYSTRSFSAAPAASSDSDSATSRKRLGGTFDEKVVGRFASLRSDRAKTASESAHQTLPNGIRWLSKKQCRFAYRESIFKKKKDWIILGAEFKFKKGDLKQLQKTSKEIIKMREQKYRPGLLCPGSFFKNIVINNVRPAPLRRRFLKRIDKTKIIHGRVPAGRLLEETGAKGMKIGNIKVAGHHGNLIYNLGQGKTSEIVKMAKILKSRVRKKFGINLDEEIQYI